jgi:hypothetical protein
MSLDGDSETQVTARQRVHATTEDLLEAVISVQ